MFFVIFDSKFVHMLCLSCKDKNRTTNLGNDLSSYKNLWKTMHSRLDGSPIKTIDHFLIENRAVAENWGCNIHKGYVLSAKSCTILTMM